MRCCRYCGENMKDDVLFCPSCGKSVSNPDLSSDGEKFHFKTGEELVKDENKIKWMGINMCVLLILQIWMPYIKLSGIMPMNVWYLTGEDGLEIGWVPWMIMISAIASLVLFAKKINIPTLVVHGIYDILMLIPFFGLIGEEVSDWFPSMGFLVHMICSTIFLLNAIGQFKIERYQKSIKS